MVSSVFPNRYVYSQQIVVWLTAWLINIPRSGWNRGGESSKSLRSRGLTSPCSPIKEWILIYGRNNWLKSTTIYLLSLTVPVPRVLHNPNQLFWGDATVVVFGALSLLWVTDYYDTQGTGVWHRLSSWAEGFTVSVGFPLWAWPHVCRQLSELVGTRLTNVLIWLRGCLQRQSFSVSCWIYTFKNVRPPLFVIAPKNKKGLFLLELWAVLLSCRRMSAILVAASKHWCLLACQRLENFCDGVACQIAWLTKLSFSYWGPVKF